MIHSARIADDLRQHIVQQLADTAGIDPDVLEPARVG